MYILWIILEQCQNNGVAFLEEALLKPKQVFFDYSYTFNAQGDILSQIPRHHTERNQNEGERYKRIAIESVYEYNNKNNRNIKNNLIDSEMQMLSKLCNDINNHTPLPLCISELSTLVETIEKRIIRFL